MILTVVNPKERQKQNITFPIVGNVDLDSKGQFNCPDDKVESFCKAVAASFPFSRPDDDKQQLQPPPAAVPKLTKKQLKELEKKAKKEAEETLVDADTLIEAITEADANELKQLVDLVPGINSKLVPTETEAMRNFLLDKIKQIQTK